MRFCGSAGLLSLMPAPTPVVRLRHVAEACAVSLMTVSRVLNNSPHVQAETRVKVQQALERLGYRPDPQIARLMSRVRSCRRRRVDSVIGVVRDDVPDDALHDPAYRYVSIDDIRHRAELHGYRAEDFHVGRGGLTAGRLGRILETRGIEGLIVSPQSSRALVAQLDYARFATATFGYGLQSPDLHRASTNMTRGILSVAADLEARGYRRIGLAVSQWIDDRSDHTYSGAMLNYQHTVAPARRVPLLLFPDNRIREHGSLFCAWMKKHRPDALISFDAYVPEWITKRLKLRIPEDVGLVVHDWVGSLAGLAGIDHRRAEVAAAAVDLIATQLMQNERGIPAVPRQILIPPRWVEGGSVRPRASGSSAS